MGRYQNLIRPHPVTGIDVNSFFFQCPQSIISGIKFVKQGSPINHQPMHIQTKGKTRAALLDLYNKEVETLKSRLLNGTRWEDLVITRENITNLAIAIHEDCARQAFLPSNVVPGTEKV